MKGTTYTRAIRPGSGSPLSSSKRRSIGAQLAWVVPNRTGYALWSTIIPL